MKTIVKTLLAAALTFASVAGAAAQSFEEDPRYGATREERIENAKKLNFLRDAVQMKNWNEAAVYVKELMNDAPESTTNIYIWGVTVYNNKVARARSVAQKNILVDSVMLIYDRRNQYFGNTTNGSAYILPRKARDYFRMNPLDGAGVRKFYKEAVDANAGTPDGALVVEYFQQIVNGFKGFEIGATDLLAEYERLAPMMDNAEETPRNNFNTLFASSGAASCDVLEGIYKEELAPDPENIDVLTKAFNLMSMIDCQSDFYVQVAEKYYAKAPSTATAIRLATVFENRKEYSKALTYLNEILPTETDPTAKANIYVRIAASELGASHSSAAAAAARSAIALNADNGFAHMFLAEAYIAGSAGCGGFHAQSVFWLAYDELARARQTFAGDEAQLARIDARMGNCRANFPTFEEGFMYVDGYADGKSHYVSCGWVSGTTTIRSR